VQASLVVWGEDYIRLARDICLPSLGFDGVTIFTDKAGQFGGYKVVKMPLPERKHRYVTECHRTVLKRGEPTILLCADMVFGKGSFKTLERLSKTYKLVVVPAVRLHMEAMEPFLKAPLSNRELSSLALAHLHPRGQSLFSGTSRCPYQSYRWDGKDLKARCYHMHPILMTGLPGSGTVDNGVDNFKPEETYVVQDSDELAVFELSAKKYDWGSKGDGATQAQTDEWVRNKTNSMHRWFFEKECTIHG
jgi:hypothetical protein